MLRRAGGAARAAAEQASRIDAGMRRVALFVAPEGALSAALLHAVEYEFSWISVEQVNRVDAACSKFDFPVRLILFESAFLKDIGQRADLLKRQHPNAMTVAMVDDQQVPGTLADAILTSGTVRGVLPMNIQLDGWLCIFRLLLQGIPYLPPSLFRYGQRRLPQAAAPAPEISGRGPSASPEAAPVKNLTTRELEVLSLVSRGYQNKIVAAKLGLSDHTVKVHLHSIITKLSARNRTDAAVMYRKYHSEQHRLNMESAARPSDKRDDSDRSI